MKYSHMKRAMIGCIIILSALSAGPAAAMKVEMSNRATYNSNSAPNSQPTYKQQHSKGGGCGPVMVSFTTAFVPCVGTPGY